MKRLSIRVFIASTALSLLWLLSTSAQASSSTQTATTPTPMPPGVSTPGQEIPVRAGESDDLPDCRECHWEIYMIWEDSLHGQGLSCSQCHQAANDDDFHAVSGHGAQSGGSQECMVCHTTGYNAETDTWNEGNIHCTACHSPIDPDHPAVPMPTNRSADLCGQCHIQANFEWQVSKHGQANVSCVDCHNQHRASLKTKSEEIDDQCAVCHQRREFRFASSLHAEAGLSCADCHLAPLENNPLGRGNAKLNHTFEVDISGCMQCHNEMLHESQTKAEEDIAEEVGSPDAAASAFNGDVMAAPPTSDPKGLLVFVTAFGGGAGMGALFLVANLIQKARKRKQEG